MSTFTLKEEVLDYLKKHPEVKYTGREIAREVIKNYPEKYRRKKEKLYASTNLKTLEEQVADEIRRLYHQSLQKKYPEIKTIESRPRKYYYTEATDRAKLSKQKIMPLQRKMVLIFKKKTSMRNYMRFYNRKILKYLASASMRSVPRILKAKTATCGFTQISLVCKI